MIAVIFESWPKPGKGAEYIAHGQRLNYLLEQHEGFISVERFESVVEPGKYVAISYWKDEASVDKFRKDKVHRGIQKSSRQSIFNDYRMRVGQIIRAYTKHDRTEAPEDSHVNVADDGHRDPDWI